MKRLVTAAATIGTVACIASGVDQNKFENVYRAGQAARSAADTKSDILHYRALVATFVREVSVVQGSARGAAETALAGKFAVAAQAYRDGFNVWQAKIHGVRDLSPIHAAATKEIVERYGLLANQYARVDPGEALQVIWTRAAESLSAANASYNSR